MDPHGAVAFKAAEKFLNEKVEMNTKMNKTGATTHNQLAIILETAHPVKFPEVVEEAIGQALTVPASVQNLFEKSKVSIPLASNYSAFKTWMLKK